MFLTRASILFICGSYFISKILDHLYYHSSEFSFRQSAYYFLNLFGLVSFYHAPSSAPSSSVLSFSLIYFVCSLLSAGRNVSFPLSCAVCACVSLGQFLVKVSCWEGLVQVLQWVLLNLISLKGSISPSGVFWGICELAVASSRLSANGEICFPLLLAVWSEASGSVVCWPLAVTRF